MASNRDKMIEKYGSQEAYSAHMREIGLKGASRKVPKGFAVLPTDYVKQMAAKGGSRGKNKM